MWTYNIRGKGLKEGNLSVTVDYTNGVDQFTQVYFPQDLDQLKRTIKQQLDKCNTNEELSLQFDDGKIDLTLEKETDKTVFIEPIKTPEQEYNQKRGELITAKQDLDLGLIKQADFDSLLAEAKSLKSKLT